MLHDQGRKRANPRISHHLPLVRGLLPERRRWPGRSLSLSCTKSNFLDSGMRVTNNTNDKCCRTVGMKHSSDHFVDLTAARTGVCQIQGRIAARRGQASPTKQAMGNHGMQHFVLTAGSNKIWTNHDNPQKPPIHTKNETSNLFARKFALKKRCEKETFENKSSSGRVTSLICLCCSLASPF